MPYYPPDTPPPPQGVPQEPAAPNAGPAPVPYTGSDRSPEPPVYSAGAAGSHSPGTEVMGAVSGNAVMESGYAHDVNAGLVVPYEPGNPQRIYTGGDNDAGGIDIVSGTVAGAVANAEARFLELQGDVFPQGSKIGDVMTFPDLTATGAQLDPGTAPGVTLPSGGFYDPPRDYGDAG